MDAMSENLAWGRERDEAFAKEQAAIAEERELPSYREVEQELHQRRESKQWASERGPLTFEQVQQLAEYLQDHGESV